MPDVQPLLYGELADWYPLLTAPADYAEEAAFYTATIHEHAPGARSLIELGCGGGNNASFMKADFAMTLTDRSPAMLDVSRGINPECEHRVGDMRTLRLDATFDGVFVHDAVMYLTEESELRDALATAVHHADPGGGLVLFAPDAVRETWREATTHGGHDGDGRSLRYQEWLHDPDPDDTEYCADFAYMLREAGRPLRVVHDRHRFGIFPRALWLQIFEDAGLTGVHSLRAPFEANEGFAPEVFLGVRNG